MMGAGRLGHEQGDFPQQPSKVQGVRVLAAQTSQLFDDQRVVDDGYVLHLP